MRNNIKRFLPKMHLTLAASFAVVALNILFGAGAIIGRATSEIQTAANTTTGLYEGFNPAVEARVIETNTIQYVDNPVTVVKYVDRVETVATVLRNFNDLEELKQWLVAVNMNTTTIYVNQPGAIVDCDDFALALQRKALNKGFLMSFQIIEPAKYNSLFQDSKIPLDTLHAIDLVLIGNKAYYIEPQTGEVVLAACVD